MDFSLVAILSAVLGLLLALSLALSLRWVPDAEGAVYWAWAFVPLALGAALLSRGDDLPATLLVLRDPTVLAGHGLLLIGLRQHLGLPRPWALAGTVVLASLVASAFFTAVMAHDATRHAVRSLGVLVIASAAAWSLRHVARPALREVRLFLQATFGLMAVLALLRTVLWFQPAWLLPLDPGTVQAGGTVLTSLLLLGVIAGLALLLTAGMNESLGRMRVHDGVTGLFNRHGLEDAAAASIALARRVSRPVALLVCELQAPAAAADVPPAPRAAREADAMPAANAAHAALLRHFAARLGAQFPRSVAVARLQGMRFAVLLPGLDAAHALQAAERLRSRVEDGSFKPIDAAAWPSGLRLSAGVALTEEADTGFDALLQRAEQALAQALHAGGNCVVALPPALPPLARHAPEQGRPAGSGTAAEGAGG